MVQIPQVQTKSLLGLIGLTALLSACGGSSSDSISSSSISSSSPSTTTTLAEVTVSKGSSSTSSDGPAGQDASQYTLTFADDFNNELDRSVWRTDRTDTASSTSNYATRDGMLKIWPQRGADGEFFNRTFDTEGRFSQQYGYFEMEAKLPKGKGVWPAFWLYSQAGGKRPEIDILEAYPGGDAPWGKPDADGVPVSTMYAPVTWTDEGERAGYAKVETPDLSAGFHRYGVKWEPNRQTFYFDGREVFSHEVSISDPLFIIVDLWFGSASGQPNGQTPTGESNAFEVNYVKAWQFK